MHPAVVRAEVLALVAAGINDCEIARRTGLPRTTVRDIRTPRRTARPACPRCWRPIGPMRFSAGEYAELLGLYLGDGDISHVGRSVRLRLTLDAAYPQIVDDARSLLAGCFRGQTVGGTTRDGGATAVLWVYSTHLPCLFPQHGAGKKHERRIELEPWQRSAVAAAPWSFLRGLVHSDGCFFINRTGRYRYLSVDFRNLSAGILDLFEEACEAVGVECRRYASSARVHRRASVALCAAFIGSKR